MLLTWFGTLEQVEHGLFETQKKYFESLGLIHWIDATGSLGFRIPCAAGSSTLLLALLLMNLLWLRHPSACARTWLASGS